MPGRQSAHPLSPFFLAGHEAWCVVNRRHFSPAPQSTIWFSSRKL